MTQTTLDPVEYSAYLALDTLLSCQRPLSARHGDPAHDEMLFIVVHQAHELWFRQILHELDSILEIFRRPQVDETEMGAVVARLERITGIQKLLVEHVRILETMTPHDFLDFRDFLAPASGFQSLQFRLLEIKLGLRPDARLSPPGQSYTSAQTPQHQEIILRCEAEPTLFGVVERWLERTPFLSAHGFDFWQSYRDAVGVHLQRERLRVASLTGATPDERAQRLANLERTERSFRGLFDENVHRELVARGERRLSLKATLAALFIHLYRDEPILQLPFRLLGLIEDMDELLQSWRHQHSLMVHRMIGVKVGTGGSSGYQYLRETVDRHRIFGDFFSLSTYLLPRSLLPRLPDDLRRCLRFQPLDAQGPGPTQ